MNARTALGSVSRLEDLPALERHVIAAVRLWRAGEAGQAALRRDLAARCGPAPARSILDRLDDLVGALTAHGRRPMQVGAVGEPGVCGDECVIARFVALAAEGACEDAVLIATLLVRADLALGLGRTAEALGLSLLRAPEPAAPRRAH